MDPPRKGMEMYTYLIVKHLVHSLVSSSQAISPDWIVDMSPLDFEAHDGGRISLNKVEGSMERGE